MKKFTATVMECDVPNRNGHIYSSEMMKDAFEKFLEKGSRIGTLADCGEFSHEPELMNATHLIDKVYFDNNVVKAEGRFLDDIKTDKARTVELFGFENLGCKISGYGKLNADTHQVEDFQLMSIDLLPKEQCGWDCTEIKETNE